MNIKLLTQHHLEFLSLTGDCTGSSESTLVKMPHCWKSHAAAHKSLLMLSTEGKIHHKISIFLNDIQVGYQYAGYSKTVNLEENESIGSVKQKY